jgi:hypothetical protein
MSPRNTPDLQAGYFKGPENSINRTISTDMLLLPNDETSGSNKSTTSMRHRRTNRMPLKSLYKDSNTPNKASKKKLTVCDGEGQTASAREIEMEILSKSNQVAKDFQNARQTIKTVSANKDLPNKSDLPDYIDEHDKKNMLRDFSVSQKGFDSQIDFSSRLRTEESPKVTPKGESMAPADEIIYRLNTGQPPSLCHDPILTLKKNLFPPSENSKIDSKFRSFQISEDNKCQFQTGLGVRRHNFSFKINGETTVDTSIDHQ